MSNQHTRPYLRQLVTACLPHMLFLLAIILYPFVYGGYYSYRDLKSIGTETYVSAHAEVYFSENRKQASKAPTKRSYQ